MAICIGCNLELTAREETDGICYKCRVNNPSILDTPEVRERITRIQEEKNRLQKVDEEKKKLLVERRAIIPSMLISTSESIHGKTIVETLGIARGSTVRSKHIGRDIMAEVKSIVGGELKGYTEMLAESREHAIYRMKEDACSLGADAVVAVRMNTAQVLDGAAEIIAYGTAVKLKEM